MENYSTYNNDVGKDENITEDINRELYRQSRRYEKPFEEERQAGF